MRNTGSDKEKFEILEIMQSNWIRFLLSREIVAKAVLSDFENFSMSLAKRLCNILNKSYEIQSEPSIK